MNYAHFCELQQQNEQLLALQVNNSDNYINLQKILFNPIGKIVWPESMVVHTIKWFHQVMRHPGKKRLHEMLNQRHHHPKLWYQIDAKEVTRF